MKGGESSASKLLNSDRAFDVCSKIFVWLLIIIVAYPLVYILSASISDHLLCPTRAGDLLPKGITFEGFQRVFQSSGIWIGYRNTIFYTVLGTLINLPSLPCAYALRVISW